MVNTGRYCVFEKIDENIGIKRYVSKKIAKIAYSRQLSAFKVNAAPKPLEWVDEKSFKTEIADVEKMYNSLLPKIDYGFMFPDLIKALTPILGNNELGKKSSNRINNIDLARHNIGIYNKRVVMVDFT